MPERKRVSSAVKALMDKPDNKICADCDSKFIKFADVNYGVFLCRECSEGHTKKLSGLCKIVDVYRKWEPQWLATCAVAGGNRTVNREHYESNIHNFDGRKRPNTSTRFIYDKYKFRFFCDPNDKTWLPTPSGDDLANARASGTPSGSPSKSATKKTSAKKARRVKSTTAPAATTTPAASGGAWSMPAAPAKGGEDSWDPFNGGTTVVAPPVPTNTASANDSFGDFTSAPDMFGGFTGAPPANSNNNNNAGNSNMFGNFQSVAPVANTAPSNFGFMSPAQPQPQQAQPQPTMAQTTNAMGALDIFNNSASPASGTGGSNVNIDIFFGGKVAAPSPQKTQGNNKNLNASLVFGESRNKPMMGPLGGSNAMPRRPMSGNNMMGGGMGMGMGMNRPMQGGMHQGMGMRNMGMGMQGGNMGMGMGMPRNNMGMGMQGMGMRQGMHGGGTHGMNSNNAGNTANLFNF